MNVCESSVMTVRTACGDTSIWTRGLRERTEPLSFLVKVRSGGAEMGGGVEGAGCKGRAARGVGEPWGLGHAPSGASG